MTPTTLYLKYRPQKLSELDSAGPREELIKIFKSEKFPHAFLFTGPKGIGKTSAARIIAKKVNCLNKKQFEPCNDCVNCLSITRGSNVDVLEIDAASNRGIDDIKELREKIKLAPSCLKYKVYIIDEAHMLTTEAFNALLKTLEEPPAHALFILCTTDPEKLPKTITSRCLVINFKKATKKEIVDKLRKVCDKEKWQYEEKALEEIAKLSDGSFRDANKVLDQVSFSGKILLEEVNKLSGVSVDFNIEDFLLILQKRQAKEAVLWINKQVEQGVNLKVFVEKLLDAARNILLTHFGIEEEKLENKFDFSQEELECLIGLFTRAYGELRFAVIAQLPLEMAVIEWCQIEGEDGKREVSRDVGAGSEKTEKSDPLQTSHPHSTSNFSPPSQFSFDDVVKKWSEILEKVKLLNHSVLAFLKATRPLNCEDGFLVLEVFYKFHKDQLEKDQCRKIFEKAAGEVLGCEVKLKCNLSETKRQPQPLPKVDFIPPTDKPLVSSQTNDNADIIKLAEEIFNKGGTIQ